MSVVLLQLNNFLIASEYSLTFVVCGSTWTAWRWTATTSQTSTSASAATLANSTSSAPCTSRNESASSCGCRTTFIFCCYRCIDSLEGPCLAEIDTSATESENETKTTIYMDTSATKGKNKIWTTKYDAKNKTLAANKNKRKTMEKRKPVGRKKISIPRVHKVPKVGESALERPQSIWSRLVELKRTLQQVQLCFTYLLTWLFCRCSKQFADTYEEAQSNYLTREVLQYLCNRPPSAAQDDMNRSAVELRARLYTVGHLKHNKKASPSFKCPIGFVYSRSPMFTGFVSHRVWRR